MLSRGADLLIIGRGLMTSNMGRLRTHAYGIIQASSCPVTMRVLDRQTYVGYDFRQP